MKLLLLTVLFALASACASFRLHTPPGFATLDANDDYAYRATSADGVVIAVRSERNRPEGNLDFWAGAIDDRLRATGYTPDGDPRPVHSADGVPGLQRRYARDVNGRTLRYWTTVFVKGSRVYLVEAGGDREVFDRSVPALEQALASIRF